MQTVVPGFGVDVPAHAARLVVRATSPTTSVAGTRRRAAPARTAASTNSHGARHRPPRPRPRRGTRARRGRKGGRRPSSPRRVANAAHAFARTGERDDHAVPRERCRDVRVPSSFSDRDATRRGAPGSGRRPEAAARSRRVGPAGLRPASARAPPPRGPQPREPGGQQREAGGFGHVVLRLVAWRCRGVRRPGGPGRARRVLRLLRLLRCLH